MTDPISDMLTRIRNGLQAKKPEVVLPYSRLKANLARLFAEQGWLLQVEEAESDDGKLLRLVLKYDAGGAPAISGIVRVSRPGQRIYAASTNIPRVSHGIGATIVSTSKGLLTDKEARSQKIGGEVICQVW